ncbi:MAG: substrate-binding domain-containing protein [Prevotella sp.]|nr:substrate-binding domain-containing protein [Prevotella sp.]
MHKTISCIIALIAMLTSCSNSEKTYRIAVSQCSEDIWRNKLNDELKMGTYVYDNVELSFASADDSDDKQIEQINQFLDDGMDLLIVAPNQVARLSPAIDKVFDKGIPVIVVDRKTNSEKYTAFIGADNFEMGRLMGEYIAKHLGGKGRVMEIMGLKDSSPAIERHNGFVRAISSYPGITLVASLQGDWTEESAVKAVKEWLQTVGGDLKSPTNRIDFVFGQNDRMAVGASKALSLPDTKYCGIDGLPGEGNGIECVRDSVLEASYIYPTHGDEVLQLAMNILEGKPYEKDNRLMASLVTKDNANVLLLQNEELVRQSHNVDLLHAQADNYLHELNYQRIITLFLAIIIFVIVISGMIIVSNMRRRHRLERQAFSMVVNVPESEEPIEKPSAQEDHPHITVVTPEEQTHLEAGADARFLEKLRSRVQEQMGDSDFSVETLAEQMGVSRVQLYRKVKTLTGRTPVDIIRLSRLNRSKVLLETTDKNVSEVAYEVGFTAPSYFTKCFKDEFGISPSDL